MAVVVGTLLLLLGALYLLIALQHIVRWLVIALFLAVALHPVVERLHRLHLPRGLAILLVYVVLFLLLGGLAALVVPPLVEQIQGLVHATVQVVQQPGGPSGALRHWASQHGLTSSIDTLLQQARSLPNRLSVAAGPLLTLTRGIVSSLTALVSILLVTFFLLLDGRSFIAEGLHLVAPAQRPRARRLLAQSARAVHGYITGNLAISVIAGAAVFGVLAVLHVRYAVALALIVAVLDLIPLVGATLGAGVVVLVGPFVSPLTAVILVVYFALYQQLENNVLQPLVYGRSVHLHPLAIFIAVLVGADLLGILGALIAIPVAEILRLLGAEWLAARRQRAGVEAGPAP